MEINYNVVSVIDLIGLVQGIVLGTLLIIINHKKKSTIFLGLAILSFSTGFIPLILQELHITDYYPSLQMTPFMNQWILIPLFYVYLQQVSIFSDKKTNFRVLYPGVIFLVVQIFIFFLPVQTKIDINNALWFDIVLASGLVYGLVLLFLSLNLVKRHINEVENQFSSSNDRHLNWVEYFIYGSFVLAIMAMIIIFVKDNVAFRVAFSCFYVLMVFWLSIKGIMQHNVNPIIHPEELSKIPKTKEAQTNTDEISNDELRKLVMRINEYMNSSKVFVNSELTIVDIAEALRVHPRRISTAINTISNQNFNSYVNQYRIKKAEELLAGLEVQNLSIEGIGLEVGFNSKSSFYSAFKKITGTTPSRYKERLAS